MPTTTVFLSTRTLAIEKQEMRVNWKNKAWKYSTAFVVVLLILNPEMADLALVVDAIGLEIFLMLLEIQVVAILWDLYNTTIKPTLLSIKRLGSKHLHDLSWNIIFKKTECMILTAPNPAFLMHILVFSVAIATAFNVI